MKTNETYCKFFETENEAIDRCSMKNKACKLAGNYKDIYCLIDGPTDNYAVVDLKTAISHGTGYQICD